LSHDENFYATLAQVLPLLLLALIWDSGYLTRLRSQQRLPKKVDSAGVRFWTKPRVRVYILAVTGVVIVSTGVTVFVLAGLIPDSRPLRIALSAGLALILITLMTRITIDVILATKDLPKSPASSMQSSDAVSMSRPHPADTSAWRSDHGAGEEKGEPDIS
jgi:hypothetical protein